MHLKGIAGAVKAHELGAQAAVKTAAKEDQGSFGESLRAVLGETTGGSGVAKGAVAKGAVANGSKQVEMKDPEQEGEGGQPGIADGETKSDSAQVAVARRTVLAERLGGKADVSCAETSEARAACGVKAVDDKTAKNGKGEARTAKDTASVESAKVGPAVAATGAPMPVSAAMPVQARAQQVQQALEPVSALEAQGKSGSGKMRKAAVDGKDPAETKVGDQKPAATVAAASVVTSHAIGQAGAVVMKDAAVGETSVKGGSVAEPVALVAAGFDGMHAGQGVETRHSAKESVRVATAAPAGISDGAEVKTLAATPNVLEVGLSDGTHGWLKVRAQVGQAGEIAASLVTTTAGQAEMLRRELPAIASYLTAESVGVSSVAVHAAGQSAGAQDAAASAGGMMQGGQRGGGTGASREERSGETGLLTQGGNDSADEMWFKEVVPAGVLSMGSGRWLSVVA